jgi:hypothetical protein
MGIQIADIHRDGGPDVVAGEAWYRHVGRGSSWTRYPCTTARGPIYAG